MPQRWTATEIKRLLERRQGNKEGKGDEAFLDVKVRVTPERLHDWLGGHWTGADGRTFRFDGVTIDDEGFAKAVFVSKQAGGKT